MARVGVDYSKTNAINIMIGVIITAVSGILLTFGAAIESGEPIHASWLILLVIVGLFWFGSVTARYLYYDATNGTESIKLELKALEKKLVDLM